MFAKLFEVEGKQYLATLNRGALELFIAFESEEGMQFSTTLEFEDTDESYDNMIKAFDNITEESLVKICNSYTNG